MRDQHEFKPVAVEIEEAPVSPLGRVTFWIILAVAAFVIIWLSLGEVDVVVTARGKIIPRGQIKVIQPLDSGVVKALHVDVGESVKKGQLLVEIEPDTTEPGLEASDEQALLTQITRERLNALLAGFSFNPDPAKYPASLIAQQRALYQSTKNAHQEALAAKRSEAGQISDQEASVIAQAEQANVMLTMLNQRADQMKGIEDLISRRELDDLHERQTQYQTQANQSEARLAELSQRRTQLKRELTEMKQRFRQDLLAQEQQQHQQGLEFQAKSKEFRYRNTRQRILAPVAGTVNQRMVNTPGGVVTPAQPLLTLVPKDTPIQIEALAENRDIGYIHPGMEVSVKVDTYDFQKYGVIEGKVISVGSDSIEDEQLGQVFPVIIQPEKTSILVKGKDQPLHPGMTVQSEIKVGQRRIIEFFIYPVVKALDESFSLR